MSRTRRFLSSVSFGYIYQALILLTGLWLTPFLLNHIGQNDYGLWLVGTQILFYLMLIDFGVVALLPRETAYATGRAGSIDKAEDLPIILGQTLRLVLWQMPFIILAALALWFFMPGEWEALQKPFGLAMLVLVITFPLRIFQAVLRGLQDLTFLGQIQLVTWVFSTAATVVFVLIGFGLYSLAIGWAITQIVTAFVCFLRLRKSFPTVLPRHLPALPLQIARVQLTRGFWVTLGQVALLMLSGTDLIIIGKLFGATAVVPFACTGKLISVMANQPQMLTQAAGPALSEIRAGESREKIMQVCTSLTLAVLLISGAVFCLVLIINQGFVNWWVGPEQYSGFGLTLMLLVNMLLRHWSTTAIYSIFCFGYERRISLIMIMDGIVTLVASLILIWSYGPIGAPIGAIIGVCLVSLPGLLSPLARESGVSVTTLMKTLWPWLWRFLPLAAAAWVVAKVWSPNGFIALALTTVFTISVYILIMMPVALQSPLGIYVRPRLAIVKMKLFGVPLAKDA